jgi:hypothetical protein
MDELDRLLSSDETLVPSSGFQARVMEAVQDAAVAPPPPSFPWGRFAVGVVACAAWAGASVGLARRIEPTVLADLAAIAPDLLLAAGAVAGSLGVLFAPRVLAGMTRR